MANKGSSTAHSIAINAIANARQNTRQYRFQMENNETVEEGAIFIDPSARDHPQKKAHAALLDYHEEVNQPEYTKKVNDLWQENLKNEAGHDIRIDVPNNDEVTRVVKDPTRTDAVLPTRDELETKTEKISLEMLGRRWSGRSLTVNIVADSPYYDVEKKSVQLRMWLPPKAIKAAYSQLNSVLSRISLLAKTDAPIEYDPDPV